MTCRTAHPFSPDSSKSTGARIDRKDMSLALKMFRWHSQKDLRTEEGCGICDSGVAEE